MAKLTMPCNVSIQAALIILWALYSSRVLAKTCKCGPDDAGWPSASEWTALNASVSGQLIANVQPAAPCYPGPQQDAAECARVDALLKDQTFVSETAIGLSYPTGSCPPVNATAGERPGTCSIGDQPRYTVNATEPSHVTRGISFARRHRIRLVIRNTGHDILGRSTGYGSLQIWVKYIQKGIEFQKTYKPSSDCSRTTWTGSAFSIGGGYTWNDIYDEAARRGLVVVGGGTPSVSCLGGWMQGGGHGPAVHNYGLGADQVLEARVILANGKLVTASPCDNPDLFFAIRGGGPSTYGIVISTVIKAHPTTSVAAQQLSFTPRTPQDLPYFMEALTVIYGEYPDLSDAGFAGYGSWAIASPFSPYSAGYQHSISNFGQSISRTKSLFASTAAKLERYSSNLFINTTYSDYPDFATYYTALSNISSPIGQSGALGSRFLDRKALTADSAALNKTLYTLAATPDQFTSINVVFQGGGQVFKDQNDRFSGLNPAWRRTYVHNIVARGWAPGSDEATKKRVRDDITYTKVQAMKSLAPDTGSYMNEGDVNDPTFLIDFYGTHLGKLTRIKNTYDPLSVFYCPTCIGSEKWQSDGSGKLCLKGS